MCWSLCPYESVTPNACSWRSLLSTDYDSYKINNNSNPSTLNLDIDNLTENLSTLNTNINDNYV
jgi:hypothetical protein